MKKAMLGLILLFSTPAFSTADGALVQLELSIARQKLALESNKDLASACSHVPAEDVSICLTAGKNPLISIEKISACNEATLLSSSLAACFFASQSKNLTVRKIFECGQSFTFLECLAENI